MKTKFNRNMTHLKDDNNNKWQEMYFIINYMSKPRPSFQQKQIACFIQIMRYDVN